jgi:nitronate monooxygenase
MGADAVIMGTRMLVAEELWIHPDVKAKVVTGDGSESVVVKSAIRDHHRVLRNESAEAVLELDRAQVTEFERFRPHVMGALAHEAYVTGDTRRGMIDYGHAAIFADAVRNVEAIFDEMIDDAVASANRLSKLMV